MSISLPALDVRPPQQQDLIGQYGNLMRLKAMQQQQQQQQAEAPLRQQILQNQAQGSGLQLQQQQQAMKDQQAMTTAMQQWDGKDLNALAPLVLKNGGSAQAVMELKQKSLAMQQQYSTIAKNDAQAGTANMATMMKKNDLISGALSTVMQTPDAQLPQAVTATAQDLVQKGLLDPQHAQAAEQIAQSGDPAQIRQKLDLLRKSYMAQSQLMDEAQKTAQIAKDTAQANEANVNAKLAPQLAASRQAFQQAQLRQGAQRLNLQQQQSGLSANGAPSDLAKAIAEGHVTPERLSYLLARNPSLIQGVMQIDPSFDSSKAAAYPAVYKDFTNTSPTKAGGAILAAGTAFQHLQELQRLNTLESRNPLSKDYAAYHNQAVTVAGELAKFYGENTDEGRKSILSTLDATFNRDKAITTQAHAMGQRYDNYQQAWDNAAPSRAYQAPMPGISKAAMDARAALDPTYRQKAASGQNGDSHSLTVTAPNGKTYTFKDQASADAFKKTAGIQ